MSVDEEDHERVIAQQFAHIDEHQKEHKRRGERIDIGVLAKTCVNKLVAERDEALAQATHSSHRWHELERIQDRQLTVESLQMELAEERVEVERLQKENAAFYSAGCDAIDRNLALQKEVERLQSEVQSAIAARDALSDDFHAVSDELERREEFLAKVSADRDELLAAVERLLGSSKYSPDTIATYAAALEAAFPEDSVAFGAALKDLWKNVHCDLSGELRGPHTELDYTRADAERARCCLTRLQEAGNVQHAPVTCSFCSANGPPENRVVGAGTDGVYICKDCAQLCRDILCADEEEPTESRKGVDYTKGAPPDYKCSGCGAHGVKLWRQYQTSVSALELKCAECGVKDQNQDDGQCVPRSADAIGDDGRWHGGIAGSTDTIGWLVPAVPSENSFWGYTSVPQEGVDWWRRLPTHKERHGEP